MARAIDTDPFRCFRFAPRVGFDGKAIGVSLIEVKPGRPWPGPGVVHVEAAWKPDFVEFAKIANPFPLVIGIYHITDECGVDAAPPSGHIVLTSVNPSQSELEVDPLDAAGDDVFKIKLKMKYDRLTFIFGDGPLDKILAVI